MGARIDAPDAWSVDGTWGSSCLVFVLNTDRLTDKTVCRFLRKRVLRFLESRGRFGVLRSVAGSG